MSEETSVPEILEHIAGMMCDYYCRFPNEPIPEGKDENWLIEDEDSPCNDCPIRFL